jgi:deoxyhypusine synthase
MIPVKDINLDEIKSISDLINSLESSGGFTAKNLGSAVKILKKARDEGCTRFLSFPANIIATGTRGVIKDIVKNKLADVIITTCGTLDHDLARTYKDYYHGDFRADDKELRNKNTNRLGNIFIPDESYGKIIEDKIVPIFKKLYESGKKEISTKELCYELGKALENEENKESSILYWAYKNQIPIFIPGITDGAVGSNIWVFSQQHPDFKINLIQDQNELSSIVFDSQKTSALIVGGGISKHHVIWWNQFKNGLDYAVYITTAQEWDGSLSGARTSEAISWGKIHEHAKHITIQGDATLILPLIFAGLNQT